MMIFKMLNSDFHANGEASESNSYRAVNLKTIFSWNSIAQKTKEIFDKILP